MKQKEKMVKNMKGVKMVTPRDLKNAHDMWITIKLGNIEIGDNGEYSEDVMIAERGQITLLGFKDIKKHRNSLHWLFDDLFNRVVHYYNEIIDMGMEGKR